MTLWDYYESTCRNCHKKFNGRKLATSCSRKCAADSRGKKNLKIYESKKVSIPLRAKQRQKYIEKFSLEERKAHILVNTALRYKRLFKENCKKCGNKKAEAHHEDYSKPLDVIWLCRKCHMKRHKEMRSAAA